MSQQQQQRLIAYVIKPGSRHEQEIRGSEALTLLKALMRLYRRSNERRPGGPPTQLDLPAGRWVTGEFGTGGIAVRFSHNVVASFTPHLQLDIRDASGKPCGCQHRQGDAR